MKVLDNNVVRDKTEEEIIEFISQHMKMEEATVIEDEPIEEVE